MTLLLGIRLIFSDEKGEMILKKIGLLAGSLRTESYAKKVARNLGLLASNQILMVPVNINHLPLFSDNLNKQEQQACQEFKNQIQEMDGFVVVTPEINRGIPGCLKNALDIASVSYQGSLWQHKPVLIVSVSTGKLGGVSASQQLKQLALVLGMQPVQPTEIYISDVRTLFADHDLLTDTSVLNFLQTAMNNLVAVVQTGNVTHLASNLTFQIMPDKILLMKDGQQVGQATYQWSTQLLVVTGVTVEPGFKNEGFGLQIMVKIVMLSRLFGLSIVAGCPYTRHFFQQNPELQKALCLN